MRINKYIAHAGVASRRKAEELIKQGLVTVNGQVVRELATTITVSYTHLTLPTTPYV